MHLVPKEVSAWQHWHKLLGVVHLAAKAVDPGPVFKPHDLVLVSRPLGPTHSAMGAQSGENEELSEM